MAVGLPACMRGTLDLHVDIAACARRMRRVIKLVVASLAPASVNSRPLTRSVPALHVVVMHVSHCGSGHLHVHVVVVVVSAVLGRHEGVRVEVDAADERGGPVAMSVEEPALLMLAVPRVRAIPANVETRVVS